MASQSVTSGAVDNSQAVDKSEGQLLLERMLQQCNRYNRIRQRLNAVRASIAPFDEQLPAAQRSDNPAAPATSFFEGLNMMADGNDQVADELERAVEALARLF